ncbi:MAG: LUD domain-containing protein [Candidatus Levybacteria bacterium]|nr:LUD domain-containing protein [Candidatus Levybacteria bacterium]
MKNWSELADDESIAKTIENLKANGIDALVVDNGIEAKNKVLELLPQGAEVMNMSSVTIDTLGLPKEINESGKYDSVKNKLSKMYRATQDREMQRIGTAPEYAVGSIHAVTEDGKVIIASNTGSQLPAYAYAASHVIWIVGTQKIVAHLDEGLKRIYEYVLPLESKRLRKIYGVESNVSKLLIINKEISPNRLTLILVKEKLGF